MSMSNITSKAGSTKTTMVRDNSVPLPSNIPRSEIIGLLEVYANANHAVARIPADVRIAARLSSIVILIASFLLR